VTPAVLAFLLPALLLTAGPAPDLAITIDDGVSEAHAGDTLTYDITVENRGSAPFDGVVTLETPAGEQSWPLEIAGGASSEQTASITVPDMGNEYQVVALAAVEDTSGETVVRGADANAIPGAAAPPPVEGFSQPAASKIWWPFAAGGALLVAVAIVLFVIFLNRRKAA
jgi:hypothetical protein